MLICLKYALDGKEEGGGEGEEIEEKDVWRAHAKKSD